MWVWKSVYATSMMAFPFLFPTEWVTLISEKTGMQPYPENVRKYAIYTSGRAGLAVLELFVMLMINGRSWVSQVVITYLVALVGMLTVFNQIMILRTDKRTGPGKILAFSIVQSLAPTILTIMFVFKISIPHVIFYIAVIVANTAMVMWLDRAWSWKPRKDAPSPQSQ